MNRRKRAKENLHYIRKHPDSAPPNKNAASTVWLYEIRSVNGISYGVYTARPKIGHLHYAVRLSEAIRRREDIKRYTEAIHRYRPELLRWQQEMRQKELIRWQQERKC